MGKVKSDIGMFQEQQPNGKIASSWTRATLTIPLLMAVGYMFISVYFYYSIMDRLLDFLKDAIIDKSAFIAISTTFKVVDIVVLGTLLSITFGVKLFQKGQENKAIDNEMKQTSDEVKIEQLKTNGNGTP